MLTEKGINLSFANTLQNVIRLDRKEYSFNRHSNKIIELLIDLSYFHDYF
jgi:hypothetical protein